MKEGQLRIVNIEQPRGNGGPARRRVTSADERHFAARAAALAQDLMGLARLLPMAGAAGLCGDELLQSGGLIKTKCQAALRATSGHDFVCRLGAVAAEAQDCQAWLELLAEAGTVAESTSDALVEETEELLALVAKLMRSTRGDNGVELGRQDCVAPYLRLRR